jgi:hypothetical protein
MRRTVVLFVPTWLLWLAMLLMVGMLLVVILLRRTRLTLIRMLRIRFMVRIHKICTSANGRAIGTSMAYRS